ncbi:beta-ketoacyl synthase N-terminal-like domain-containing protein [uncultured Hyphomonas sp.]|uniref:beta-ketoacyl synthase N-terminal-like domain-containing protein n=1 Tax=uncultured Hyphomonas sp. TaxID=225298 RepID=UPI003749CE16
MTPFEPVAIVGQGCVLPGAHSPDHLSKIISDRRVVYGKVDSTDLGLTDDDKNKHPFVSGRVRGFESVFDPEHFRLKSIAANELDPVCKWPLQAALDAWEDASSPKVKPSALGVFVANLSYPSAGHVEFASRLWSREALPPAHFTLNSALPSRLIAEALRSTGPCLSLDAACASSLYAIDIACRKLQTRQIDCGLVAGVNAADNLILHIGFDALNALSPTGRSRPFVKGADGLVPSEGAAALVLKRLSDVQPGEKVHGVIRGSGLSNDGRRKGLLAPASEGQADAMRLALESGNIDPHTIQYLECHATGTAVGDGVEISSIETAYAGCEHLPLGSLKANTGHLITVAGLASVLKLTGAMAREHLPPTPLEGAVLEPLRQSNLKVLSSQSDWEKGQSPRRAAISNFGFGGNNAHLILEQYQPATRQGRNRGFKPSPAPDIVICAAALMAGHDRTTDAVLRRLMNQPVKPSGKLEEIGANAANARTPPNDLKQAEPQQLAILSTVSEALEKISSIDTDETGVFAGMACAADSARWALRERMQSSGHPPDDIAPKLDAAMVLGAMANMTANRITFGRDIRGMGYAVSADAASGLAAMDLAIDALRAGRLSTAVVAAADFATEPVRSEALRALKGLENPGDAAAALVLKRREDAESAGDPILASVGSIEWKNAKARQEADLFTSLYGTAPDADSLVRVALEVLLNAHSHKLTPDGAVPTLSPNRKKSRISVPAGRANAGVSASLALAPPMVMPDPLRPPPHLFHAAAGSRQTLGDRLLAGREGGRGNFRIALVASGNDEITRLRTDAAKQLARGEAPDGEGVYYGEGEPEGELAFMFTGSAAVYPRMARRLLMAFPEIRKKLSKLSRAEEIAALLSHASLSEFEQLCAGTLVSQAHAILWLDILKVKPDAAIGLSLGESNALFSFGYWKDPGALLDEISNAAMYERHIGGEFETAKQAWGPNVPTDWTNWRLQAPVGDVQAALPQHPGVEITIIYTDEDCMIGGPAEACRSLCETFGKRAGVKMNQHLIVHAKAMRPFAETWRRLHTREVHRGSGVRLYANAIHGAYEPETELVADMLTRQAVDTVDFPRTVRQAWKDGVRTFLELGPRDTLTASLNNTLKDRPFKAIATDRIEASDLGQIAHAAAFLFADGREIDLTPLLETLTAAQKNEAAPAGPWNATRPVPYPMPKITKALPSPVQGGLPPAPKLRIPDYAMTIPRQQAIAPCRPPEPVPGKCSEPPQKVVSGTTALKPRAPTGPKRDRQDVESSARGSMSDFFGPAFKAQDSFARQVRLPAPPLLLVDRVTGIDAAPTEEAGGVIWTETDLSNHADFIHDGRIRPGPLIECGQADLTLIGWMGADLRNQDERVYRLLGCEITFHEGGLPSVDDTLGFQIEITGHAELGGVRMFFFQYDCRTNDRLAFSVRNGQAGFFTDQELSNSKGVIWDAAKNPPPTSEPAAFEPQRVSAKRKFSEEDINAFRSGDAYACFGDDFELCAAHSNPPHIPGGKLALFDDIIAFDPQGGPWKRGYLRARAATPASTWFYDGHFHNDPCMPGTLMAEAAVQALEFYAAAVGLTVERDGYVFEPVPEHTAKFVCRGQVIPDKDHQVTYEVFIDEIVDGETPEVYASLLARCDGHKVFHCPRFGIRLRRNWPAPRVDAHPLLIGPERESRGDQAALLDCANGAPSAAFGDMYRRYDDQGNVPRLPQPPYHFISRVTSVSTRPAEETLGATMTAEYDIPADAWYFDDNVNGTMPFAVLCEIALQPCGWLASHSGFALVGTLRFRNLEGDGFLHMEVGRNDGMLKIRSTLTSISKVGPMTLVSFDVEVTTGDGRKVLDLKTQFGFFPPSSLVRQAGLPAKPHFSEAFDLRPASMQIDMEEPRAAGRMQMIDEVDFCDPDGGEAGLGLIRAQQYVDPYAWYFKAHFYQDPVQPGSLGLDALVQALTQLVWKKGLHNSMSRPHLTTLAPNAQMKWSYRGQVTPERKTVTSVMEILSIEDRGDNILITARGSLWRDGLRVYEVGPMSASLTDLG